MADPKTPSAAAPLAPVLTDADAATLQALALAAWGAQGEAEASDSAGRSWVFCVELDGFAALVIEGARRSAEGLHIERATVGQATLGAADLAGAAVAGALASVAARLEPSASAAA